MNTQQAHEHQHRHRHQTADGRPFFRRRREHDSWRLTAEGFDHDAALAVLHERRPSVGPWPRCRVGTDGSIALNVPGRDQNTKFRGRLTPDPDGDGGALVVSGVMMETMSGIMLPLVFGFAALLMLAIFVLGALTVTIPPLIIGLVGAPLLGMMAVAFRRLRSQSFDLDAHLLYDDLHTLLAPLHPKPLGASPELR